VKLAEIGIMTLGLAGFWLQSIPLLLTALFLMGCHSTIFGPAKYAIIPQHLREEEVMGGTGVIEAGTFLAILSGQLLAGLIAPWEAGLTAMALALVCYAAALAIPRAPSSAPGLRIDWNPVRSTRRLIGVARNGEGVWLCILGISWFFAVGRGDALSPHAAGRRGAARRSQRRQPVPDRLSVAVALGRSPSTGC
jgi:acyl-[acyl-carrier-protein]-phospholipid O-acyltransferase/long-chain-fatty-acid--[acyl-carrier-protein] ligase